MSKMSSEEEEAVQAELEALQREALVRLAFSIIPLKRTILRLAVCTLGGRTCLVTLCTGGRANATRCRR